MNSLFETLRNALVKSASDVASDSHIESLPTRWMRLLPSEEYLRQTSDLEALNAERDIPAGTQAWRLRLGNAGSRYLVVSPVKSLKLSSGDSADALMAAVRLRSRLDEDERADLYLLLVAPPGADSEPEWLRSSKQMELNEAFCRIFVWLPSSAPSEWEAEALAFARRLFLVRLELAQGVRGDITPISTLFGQLDIDQEVRNSWETILLQDGKIDSKMLAERLVQALAKDLGGDSDV